MSKYEIGTSVYVSTKSGFLPGTVSNVADFGYGRYYTVRFSDAGEGTFLESDLSIPVLRNCTCGVSKTNVGGFHSNWCEVGNV
jgi:hypothetical protein